MYPVVANPKNGGLTNVLRALYRNTNPKTRADFDQEIAIHIPPMRFNKQEIEASSAIVWSEALSNLQTCGS
ncbi:hypothetical protein [Azospirillum sp. SYSU D00513]|uniref:hypothetical protein n=1 Tax=Azospirillum sp. SYSU D00513 TaxID=2812561 RepID=UPI001A961BDD|nr:hypothetical protein [Azospirillum sp. SYSU D00513]